MLSFLPSPILFVINFIMLSIVTLLVSIPMLVGALFKWIPVKMVGNIINAINEAGFRVWIANNAFLMKLTNKIDWDIQGVDEIERVKGSCIIISNHISWADIVMLAHIYRGKIPITKFFLKHSLIYIPVIGLVCYAIGMPFLRRYSREQLLKNPKLKTKDLDSTRKACLSLLEHPSSLINFVEGTRHTEDKAKKHDSQYANLMPPKAASLAVALGIIGNNIDCLFNTTLLYPHAKGNIFFALLRGRLKKVVARVEKIEPKEEWIGDYLKDKQFKRKFTANLRDLWLRKDQQITEIKRREHLIDDMPAPAAQANVDSLEDNSESQGLDATPKAAPAEMVASEQSVTSESQVEATNQVEDAKQSEVAKQSEAANLAKTEPLVDAETKAIEGAAKTNEATEATERAETSKKAAASETAKAAEDIEAAQDSTSPKTAKTSGVN